MRLNEQIVSKATDLDFVEIAAHLVVHERKPIGHPEGELATRAGALVDIASLSTSGSIRMQLAHANF